MPAGKGVAAKGRRDQGLLEANCAHQGDARSNARRGGGKGIASPPELQIEDTKRPPSGIMAAAFPQSNTDSSAGTARNPSPHAP